jgi:hypothetical protein
MIKIAVSSPIKFKIGAELIKKVQGTEFSHVLIIYKDLVFQASHGAVNVTHIDVFLADNKIINEYEVKHEDIDFDFVKRQLGKKYGYKQLISIGIRYLFGIKQFFKDNKNSSFICSEFVGKALRLDWVDDETTPAQIDEYLKSLSI